MTNSYDPHPDPIRSPAFYSGVPVKRLIAWVIDTAISVVLALLVLPFTAFVGVFFFPVLVILVGFAYRTLTISSQSATWGMRMMAIELRDSRGERFDFSQAIVHTAGYALSISMVLVQLISVLLMAGSAKGQGLTDLALGSVMINRR